MTDEHSPDAEDPASPVVEEVRIMRWAPTVEMRGKLLQGGWFDEEAEVWDEHGRLVAQSSQLAGARADRPPRGLDRTSQTTDRPRRTPG